MGVSPRVRGTRYPRGCLLLPLRIIPALTGNMPFTATSHPTTTAHPRRCGERSLLLDTSKTNDGTSLRVRGNIDNTRGDQANPRLIPARGGRGSNRLSHEPVLRLIPARAGNRATDRTAGASAMVHPCACGEQAMLIGKPDLDNGSSPRVRGTAPKGGASHLQARLIPARAGTDRGPALSIGRERFIPARAGNSASRPGS